MLTKEKKLKAQSPVFQTADTPSYEGQNLYEPNGDYDSNLGTLNWKCIYNVQLKNNSSGPIMVNALNIANIYELLGNNKLTPSTFKTDPNSPMTFGHNGKTSLPFKLSADSEIAISIPVVRVNPVIVARGISPYLTVNYVPVDGISHSQYSGFTSSDGFLQPDIEVK